MQEGENALLTNIIDRINNIVIIVDVNGVISWVNPFFTQFTGYSFEEAVGKTPRFLHGTETSMQTHDVIMRELSQHRFFRAEILHYKKSGEPYRTEMNISPVLNDQQEVEHFIAIQNIITDRYEAELKTRKLENRVQELIANFSLGYVALDLEGVIISCNRKAEEILECTELELIDTPLSEVLPRIEQSCFHSASQQALANQHTTETTGFSPTLNKWIKSSLYPHEHGISVFFEDISDETRQNLLLQLEKRVLEMTVSQKHSLQETLDVLLSGITEIRPEFHCSVLHADNTVTTLLPLSAPTLPSEYAAALAGGIEISANAGSCGSSAYFQKIIAADNIAQHPKWKAHGPLAISHNLNACCSLPIVDAQLKSIGTFALYCQIPRCWSEKDFEFARHLKSVIQVVMESFKWQENLTIVNERYRLATSATHDAIWDFDLVADRLYWAEGFGKTFGFRPEDGNDLQASWVSRVHPEDLDRVILSFYSAIQDPAVSQWDERYIFMRADGSHAYVLDNAHIVRDGYGKAVRMVGAMQDITDLTEKERQITEIARINSHEIRKPLANILGITETIKVLCDDPRLTELVTMLEQSSEELDEMVRKVARTSVGS